MKIRIAPIVVAALAVLALAGCAPGAFEREEPVDTQRYTGFGVEEFVHTLSDGREVTCILVTESEVYGGAGVSCDWDNAG